MMMKLCEPMIPNNYGVKLLVYECNDCGTTTETFVPDSYELVKFKEVGDKEIRWLPINGKGGYNDIWDKLMPEYPRGVQLTMKEAELFEERLRKYSEKGKTGSGFMINDKAPYECPYCNSKDMRELNEQFLNNPRLQWLKVSCDLVRGTGQFKMK